MYTKLAMHETLELHELMNLKLVCAAKSSTFATIVTDPQLRNLLQQDVQIATQGAHQLSNLLSMGNGGRS